MMSLSHLCGILISLDLCYIPDLPSWNRQSSVFTKSLFHRSLELDQSTSEKERAELGRGIFGDFQWQRIEVYIYTHIRASVVNLIFDCNRCRIMYLMCQLVSCRSFFLFRGQKERRERYIEGGGSMKAEEEDYENVDR